MGSIVGDHGNGKAAAPAHVLLIPIGIQGHIMPLLRFATPLAREGMIVTLVTYEDKIARLTSADNGFGSELQSLGLRFVGLRGSGNKSPGTSTAMHVKNFYEDFKPVRAKLIQEKNTGIAGPTIIISDMFLSWTQELADALEIPRYVFVASGVIYARAMQGFLDYYENGKFQFSDADDGKLVYFDGQLFISGLPPLRHHELPQSVRVDPRRFRPILASVGRAAGFVVNSFLELEEKVIDTWRNTVDPAKVPKIYCAGPLLSTSVPLPNVRIGSGLEDSASKCLLFLGSQAPSSVLYVSFGSEFRLRPEQIKELAQGLEDSENPFLWVIPLSKGSTGEQTPSLTEVLPPGFESRVGERGCIVTGWAPQVQILAHSSTGGFLTHAGWNSSLESVIMGVPMIACPQGAEQHLNCRYLVDELKIAAELPTGPQNVFKRDEVKRVVRLLMVESEGKAMRRRLEELQRKGAEAVAEGGSKSRAFQEFLDDIRNHNLAPKSGSK